MKTNNTISISTSTFLKAALIILVIWFLWFVRDVVVIFLVSLLLAALIDPFADWFSKRNIPRALSVVIVYVVLICILAVIFVGLIPVVVNQFGQLSSNLSMYSKGVTDTISRFQTFSVQHGFQQNLAESLDSLQRGVSNAFGSVFTTVKGIFGGLATLFIILILTFYMVAEGDKMQKYFRSLAPVEYQPFLADLMKKMQIKIGAWLRGQLILGIVVGVSVYIGLLIIGVKYALLLGLIAGLFEIVPYVGPIFSTIPAAIIGFAHSPIMGIAVLLLFWIVQQLENHILVPKIMQKVTGLNPVVSIIALLVGIKIGGIIGAIFAIPIATITVVVLEDVFKDLS